MVIHNSPSNIDADELKLTMKKFIDHDQGRVVYKLREDYLVLVDVENYYVQLFDERREIILFWVNVGAVNGDWSMVNIVVESDNWTAKTPIDAGEKSSITRLVDVLVENRVKIETGDVHLVIDLCHRLARAYRGV